MEARPARPRRTRWCFSGSQRTWVRTAVARGGCEAREAEMVAALGWRRVAQQRQRAQLASMVDVRPDAERSEGELEIASEGER